MSLIEGLMKTYERGRYIYEELGISEYRTDEFRTVS